MAAYDNSSYLMPFPEIDYRYPVQSNPSSLYSASTASSLLGDQQFTPPNYPFENSPRPAKRQKVAVQGRDTKGGVKNNQMQVDGTSSANQAESSTAVNKPKRVRTGCLTCRERHLKCELVILFSTEIASTNIYTARGFQHARTAGNRVDNARGASV
jgi:hypothetical protein